MHQCPFGIPTPIMQWVAETFAVHTERLTHPRCAAMIPILVPTYEPELLASHSYPAHGGIQDPLTPQHWSKHPSVITLPQPEKTDEGNHRWIMVEDAVKACQQTRQPIRLVIIMHGYANTTCTRLGNIGAAKIITIPGYGVPITIRNQEYDPQNAPGIYARHKSACTSSKISIWLIDTLTKKWLHPSAKKAKRKRTPQEQQNPYAKYLALALLTSIKDGGHNVTTTSWAN